jgi:CRISPR/Cas system-associated endonuclease Cas1
VKVLFLEQPNVLMSVKDRMLGLKFAGEIFSLPRDCRTVVANGYGFAITGAAIKECIARNIELIISDNAGAFVSLFVPEPMMDASRSAIGIRVKQFAAVLDPAMTLKTARAIVAVKIKTEGHGWAENRMLLADLRRASTVDQVRHVEAKAAQAWWTRWNGFKMRFAGAAAPAGWGSWPGR